MHIILEGVDNSGKSTLASALANSLLCSIQSSEGPPKYKGEINERIARYVKFGSTIFDRHPIVSNPIYDVALGREPEPIHSGLIQQFTDIKPIFVYCDPNGRGLTGYQHNWLTETPDHVQGIRNNYDTLLTLYRKWALVNAHFIYRIGDDMRIVVRSIETLWESPDVV